MMEPCATSSELPPLVRSVFILFFSSRLSSSSLAMFFTPFLGKEILDYRYCAYGIVPAPAFEVLRYYSGANSPIDAGCGVRLGRILL